MSKAKILHIDIETAPNVVFAWRAGWKINISTDNIIEERYMLGFSYLWEDQPDSAVNRCFIHNTKEFLKNIHDDSGVIRKMREVLDEADIVVVHNGKKFDIPWFNTRALVLGLLPPSSYKVVDTLQLAKTKFNFNSNKLDYINKQLGYDGKSSMSFTDWKAAWYGDVNALEKMANYCDTDVIRLREVYRKMRGWHPSHPAIGPLVDTTEHVCNACGGTHIQKRGTYATSAGRWQRYVCMDCGHNMRDTLNLLSSKKRSTTLRNVS